jgi:hypothetical protein
LPAGLRSTISGSTESEPSNSLLPEFIISPIRCLPIYCFLNSLFPQFVVVPLGIQPKQMMFPIRDTAQSRSFPIVTWLIIAATVAAFLLEVTLSQAELACYPQTAQRRPSVEYVPIPYLPREERKGSAPGA